MTHGVMLCVLGPGRHEVVHDSQVMLCVCVPGARCPGGHEVVHDSQVTLCVPGARFPGGHEVVHDSRGDALCVCSRCKMPRLP